MTEPIAVVVVAYGHADDLEVTLGAVAAQLRPGDELVVVDNAAAAETVAAVGAAVPSARVVTPAANLGFAGGCHVGAQHSTAPLLLFLNPDAVPAAGCVEALRAAGVERPAWAAWQAVVCLEDGVTVNSAGNPVHFLGVAWAGGLGRAAGELPAAPHEVPTASGAALVVRRSRWDEVGGFDPRFFMYCEDVDLCLRLRLAGHGVGVVPAARVLHRYDFEKGAYKWFHLERNRVRTVLGDYPTPLLVLLAPALLAFEVALLGVAWRAGWGREKVRAQAAVARDLRAIGRRRRRTQAAARIPAARFAAQLTASLDSPHLAAASSVAPLVRLQAAYWRGVCAVLGRAPTRPAAAPAGADGAARG